MPVPKASHPTLKRRLLRDEAYDAIRDAILTGAFAPGERLEDEALQTWLGISRTPIREALNALARDGLVDIGAQSHTKVVSPDPDRVEDSLQTLGVLMGGVTRVTVPSFSQNDDEGALALVDEAIAAVAARDQRLHLLIAMRLYSFLLERCPNRVLADLAQSTVTSLSFRVQVTADARVPNWALLEHGWPGVRKGIEDHNPVLVELAFEEMHRLPVPRGQWDPASWGA